MREIFIKKKKEIITGGACLLVVLVIVVGSKVKANPTPISSSAEKSNTNEISRKLNDSRSDASKNSDSSKSNTGGSEGDTASKDQSKSDNGSSSNQNGDGASSGSKFKDGSFSGSAQGFKGDVKVNVVVSGGKITTIDIVENSDDEEYFSKAKALIDEIINTQSTDVNVVSGATYSSNGIINAVANALK